MRRPFSYLWLPALILFSVLISCKDTDSVTDNSSQRNITVTANVPNSFSFVVDARTFSYTKIHQVEITADTLSIGLTVANFTSGSGRIEITDSNGNSIYEKDLNSTMVSADVLKLTAAPKTVNLNLTNFTGKVVLGVAGQ